MARAIPQLDAELNSLIRKPASTVTVTRFLPEWSEKVNGMSGLHFAHGHAAKATADGTIIIRARYNSAYLYYSVISGDDLDAPETWDSLWAQSVQYTPRANFTTDTGQFGWWGGAIDIAIWDNGGTPTARIFFFTIDVFGDYSRDLRYIDVDLVAKTASGATTITTLPQTPTPLQNESSLQIACTKHTEVFLTRNEQVEPSITNAEDGWQVWSVWGTKIHRWYHNGSTWVDDASFHFHTNAESGLYRDDAFQSNSFANSNAADTLLQLGTRPCGGLAAWEIDANTVVVALGRTYWRRYGYNTHTQSIQAFICYRGTGHWERVWEAGNADFEDRFRLDYDGFAKSSTVGAYKILVWSRFLEPSDYEQDYGKELMPRHLEAVYAILTPDGRHLTSWQYLGPAETMTAANIVKANDKLYAIGWQSVYESPLALILDPDTTQETIELASNGWTYQRGNRWNMEVTLNVADASKLFVEDSAFKSGSLVRVNYGTQAHQVQVAQGFLDLATPSVSLAQRSHKGKFKARADKVLLDTRAEATDDILPQETRYIKPVDPVVGITVQRGNWTLAKGAWDTTWFGGQYGMGDRAVWRLMSFPYAWTGGDSGRGDPGECLNMRPEYKGSWWNEVCYVAGIPMVDGMIQATFRCGAINNKANFDFYERKGNHVYTTINWYKDPSQINTGLITSINWRTGGYGGSIYDTPHQSAVMAGLVFHSFDAFKKYFFCWEVDTSADETYRSYDLRYTKYAGQNPDFLDRVPASWDGLPKPFSASSHTDDTWKPETMDRCDFRGVTLGANRLYLIVSDYDERDTNWRANNKWVHRAVLDAPATGLIPGRPAELRIQILGGALNCYYRSYVADEVGTKNQWQTAFSLPYKASRFGAGRMGIVSRAHAGVQWDDYYYPYKTNPRGYEHVIACDNYVDVWNVRTSDCELDRPMEDIARKRLWQGFTPSTYRSLVNESQRQVASTTYFYNNAPVENLTVDFQLSIPDNGSTTADGSVKEAGIFCRGIDFNNPTNECIRLGLVASTVVNTQGTTIKCWVVKRYYSGGNEQAAYRDYAPIPIQLPPNTSTIPIRITVRGPVYTVWVAGNYCGHFLEDIELGSWWGLYARNCTATFKNIHVSELYEVPEFSTVEVSKTFKDAVNQIIGKRKIKGMWTPTGELKLSYFEDHEDGGDLRDSITQSNLQGSDRHASLVRVDGAGTWAIYFSANMMLLGRRPEQYDIPDIYYREICRKVAKMICAEAAEQRRQPTFVGLPDPRVEPEDEITAFVSWQNLAGQVIVDDISHTFKLDPNPDNCTDEQTYSTRQKVIL